jgi:hypothetical protein
MYAININGEDFTDRLLTGNPESGLSNLSRSVEDEDDFSPVASTIDVALSDLDGKVSDFLHLPDLMEPNAAPDGNLPSFHVEIFDDDGKFFGGYIEPATFGGCPLNAENMNEESVVRFTVVDNTKHLFKRLDKTYWDNLGKWPDIGDLEAIGVRYDRRVLVRPGALTGWQTYYDRDDYVAFAPLSSVVAFLSEQSVRLDDSLSDVYVATSLFDLMFAHQFDSKSFSSIGAILVDIARAFLSVMFIDDDGYLNFIPRDLVNKNLEPADIREYTVVETSPESPASAEFVYDFAWGFALYQLYVTIPSAADMQANAPSRTSWTHLDESGLMLQIPGDSKNPLGTTFNAIPSFASDLSGMEYDYLFWTKVGDQYNPHGYLGVRRETAIRRILTAVPQMRVRCPGVRFYPGQPAIINGIEGWRILSASIEPMEEESELLLEYRGIQQ